MTQRATDSIRTTIFTPDRPSSVSAPDSQSLLTVIDILHIVPTVGTGLVLVTITGLLNTLMESVPIALCCVKYSQVLILYLTIMWL